MRRPFVLIVGAVAGALIVAAIGASAHTGLFITKSAGLHSALAGDEATSPRVEPSETPEPTETPESQPTTKPTAEPTEAPDTDNETETNDDSQGDEQGGTGDHESSGGTGSSGGGEHGD